jgi:16S rRNA (cytosine1402-N4)-methyltransferase
MLGADSVDLLLADLGFASPQMDDPQRGFSFAEDGPLDMRMDSTAGATAADLVNELPADELANVIYQYGEERLSRVIARKIVEQRRDSPIKTTRQLAELCAAAYGPRAGRQRIHPATRTFMALRIAVNDELNRLERLLDQLPELIGPSGRAAIISFHSLEDRQVKHAFRRYAAESGVRLLTKKPLRPKPDERHANPRCRSAKLRAIAFEKTHGVA